VKTNNMVLADLLALNPHLAPNPRGIGAIRVGPDIEPPPWRPEPKTPAQMAAEAKRARKLAKRAGK